MKQALFALTFLCSVLANAVEVTATGVGATEKQAIQDAKNNALEQVTGAFVVSSSSTTGKTVQEQTNQYSGGVVRSYRVISSSDYGRVFEVTIVADVDPSKNNGVISSHDVDLTEQSIKLQEAADRYAAVEQMGKVLDDRSKAFAAVKPKLELLPQGEKTLVRVTAGVVLQPKWVDDVKLLSKQSGQPIDVSTRTSDVLWVVGTATAPFSMLGSSIVRSAANWTTEQPKSYVESNCFSIRNDKDVTECYAVGYTMGNVVRNDRFLVTVKLWSNNTLIQEMPVAVLAGGVLFAIHENGSSLYFRSSAKERKFYSKGVVWFTDAIAVGSNEFMIDTRKLAAVDRMEYILR